MRTKLMLIVFCCQTLVQSSNFPPNSYLRLKDHNNRYLEFHYDAYPYANNPSRVLCTDTVVTGYPMHFTYNEATHQIQSTTTYQGNLYCIDCAGDRSSCRINMFPCKPSNEDTIRNQQWTFVPSGDAFHIRSERYTSKYIKFDSGDNRFNLGTKQTKFYYST